jgi:DNA/RNA endonuclease G (NUC1)
VGTVYVRNDIARGHLIRRAFAVWDDTHVEAAQANEDTFHYTEAAQQAATSTRAQSSGLASEPTCWNTPPITAGA